MRSRQQRHIEHVRQVPRSDLLVRILPGHLFGGWEKRFEVPLVGGRTAIICGRSPATPKNGAPTLQILENFCMTRTGIGETRYEAGQDFAVALRRLAEQGSERAMFFTILHPLRGHAIVWTREELREAEREKCSRRVPVPRTQ